MLESLSFHRWIVHAQLLSEVSGFYSFCKHTIWSAWVSWKISAELGTSWTKDSVFSLPFGIVLLCALLQMLRHPQVYTFLPSFFSVWVRVWWWQRQEPVCREKKNVAASKIYALISISFICCDSHILFLQSARQFYWKIKWLFFTRWKTSVEVLLKSAPPFPQLFHDTRETKQNRQKGETNTYKLPFFPSDDNNSV